MRKTIIISVLLMGGFVTVSAQQIDKSQRRESLQQQPSEKQVNSASKSIKKVDEPKQASRVETMPATISRDESAKKQPLESKKK